MTVAVVIPTLNSERWLELCLSSIERQTYSEMEAIVVDGGSLDSTIDIAERHRARVIRGAFSRSTARRLGASATTAEWVLFLDSDQTVEPKVVEECLERATLDSAGALWIPEVDDGVGFWMRVRRLDRRIANQPELSYPRFFRKDAYVRVGGHAQGLEHFMEDRDLYLRLRANGIRVSSCRSHVLNRLGVLNPLELGVKGYRSAIDSAHYYERNREHGERLWNVVTPRLRRLFQPGFLRLGDALSLLLLPPYSTVVYGPRLVSTLLNSIRPAAVSPSGSV